MMTTTPETKPEIKEIPGQHFVQRISTYFLYVVVILLLSASALSIYWGLEDPHVIKVNDVTLPGGKVKHIESEPIDNGTVFKGIPIRPVEVRPGDVVFMNLNYCKLKSVDGVVVARLVGEKFTNQLTWPNDESKAGCVNTELPIPLPKDSNDDTYYVEFEVVYKVNPFKDRTVILQSDRFKVNKQL